MIVRTDPEVKVALWFLLASIGLFALSAILSWKHQ